MLNLPTVKAKLKDGTELGMVAHTFNLSTREAEADRSMPLQGPPTWSTLPQKRRCRVTEEYTQCWPLTSTCTHTNSTHNRNGLKSTYFYTSKNINKKQKPSNRIEKIFQNMPQEGHLLELKQGTHFFFFLMRRTRVAQRFPGDRAERTTATGRCPAALFYGWTTNGKHWHTGALQDGYKRDQ